MFIFFGSDRSFDVNPVGAESTFYTIRARKPYQHLLQLLLSLHSGMFIDDVIKLFLPTYFILMMLYDEIVFLSESSNELIFFLAPIGASMPTQSEKNQHFIQIGLEKPHKHFLQFLLSLYSWMLIDDVIKLILPTYLIVANPPLSHSPSLIP